nr:homeobox-leucine zipper protein [Tanacetum cinerariifolium]
MGGGVAMRAAAKVAGMGVLNTGLRGSEHPVAAASRQVTRTVASASDDLRLTLGGGGNVHVVEKAVGYNDDEWDFADVVDNVFVGDQQLSRTYLHPNATNPDAEHVETKSSLVSETLVTPSAPKGAIKAFRLLNENPQAQTVVASIASDPNVWNAVMQNAELVDFLQTHKTEVVHPDVKDASDDSSEAGESESSPGKDFMEYVEDVKQKINVTVVDMMNTLSDTFHSLFGSSSKGGFVINPDGTAASTAENVAVGASLMGLAIMVITVVVLKRS